MDPESIVCLRPAGAAGRTVRCPTGATNWIDIVSKDLPRSRNWTITTPNVRSDLGCQLNHPPTNGAKPTVPTFTAAREVVCNIYRDVRRPRLLILTMRMLVQYGGDNCLETPFALHLCVPMHVDSYNGSGNNSVSQSGLQNGSRMDLEWIPR